MVKPTQIIRRQQPTNCLSVFDPFVELALKRSNTACHRKLEKDGLQAKMASFENVF